jgi:hypothetical protein
MKKFLTLNLIILKFKNNNRVEIKFKYNLYYNKRIKYKINYKNLFCKSNLNKIKMMINLQVCFQKGHTKVIKILMMNLNNNLN